MVDYHSLRSLGKFDLDGFVSCSEARHRLLCSRVQSLEDTLRVIGLTFIWAGFAPAHGKNASFYVVLRGI